MCRKRTYHTEREAREALGRVLEGKWKGIKDKCRFALAPYRCPQQGWHIGHSLKAIKAFR